MSRKWFYAIAVLLMVLGALSVVSFARAGFLLVSPSTPAKGGAFSREMAFNGTLEDFVQQEADDLRAFGMSEEQIAKEIEQWRAELEQQRVVPGDAVVFSVVVADGDLKGYEVALREQGVPEETLNDLMQAYRDELDTAPLQAINGGGCKVRTDGAVMKNFFGEELYRYSSKIRWCYDGHKITLLKDFENYATYWGWEFKGSTKNSSGSVGEGIYSLERRATLFHPLIPLTQYPNTAQEVFGDGSSWGSANP
ncbi:MAG: hypothetical protein OHK0052_21220 [Anaerolineales bacterium]